MAYTIEVTYTTGDSFESDQVTNTIGLAWRSLELAKAALKTIKEHYDFYQEFDACYSNWKDTRSEKAILKDVNSRVWCRGKAEDKYSMKAKAKMDDRRWRNIPTGMWCGYFETLHSARVVLTEGSDDMTINFD